MPEQTLQKQLKKMKEVEKSSTMSSQEWKFGMFQ